MNNDLTRLIKLMQTHCFSVTPCHRGTKQQNYESGKLQEGELTQQLNHIISANNLKLKAVMSCDSKYTGIMYTTVLDLCDGDIFIYATNDGKITGNPLMYIDVKVAFISFYKDTVSTITRSSFDNFANKSFHFYWCFNMDGSRSILINSVEFYNHVNKFNPWKKSIYNSNKSDDDFIMGIWIGNNRQYFEVKV